MEILDLKPVRFPSPISLPRSLNQEEPLNWLPEIAIRIAILDMNNGARNIGIRNIKRIISNFSYLIKLYNSQIEFVVDHYHVRDKGEVPNTSYDIYIGSGGPGSPLDDSGAEWEMRFFGLLDQLLSHNETRDNKKFFFGICHSFQLMVKKFEIARITRREKRNLGIVPIFKTPEGKLDPIFEGLHEKFYAFDNRDWQATDPNDRVLRNHRIELLSYDGTEEAAGKGITGIRFSDEMEAVQFHPEAEKNGILMRFTHPDEMQHIIGLLGRDKYDELLASLENPNKLVRTYKTVLPGFLLRSYNRLMGYYDMPALDRSAFEMPNLTTPGSGPSLFQN